MTLGYARCISIDHTKCGSTNSASFPVLVSGTYAYLATRANGGRICNTVTSNGQTIPADLGFYADPLLRVPLPFEVGSYNATTGAITAWVQVPSLLSSADLSFFMGYGDPASTADISGFGSGTRPWDSNFQAVFHLQDVTGGSNSVLDSTSNAKHGTPTNSPTNTTGQIAGGGHFVGASSQRIAVPITDLSYTNGTVSFWMNQTDIFSGGRDSEPFLQASGGSFFSFEHYVNNNLYIGFYGGADYRIIVAASATNWVQSAWALYSVAWTNAGTTELYVNGVSKAVNGGGTVPQNVAVNFLISANTTAGINGDLDEFRISNTRRNVDWHLAEYNNQLTPSTFYAIGPEIPILQAAPYASMILAAPPQSRLVLPWGL